MTGLDTGLDIGYLGVIVTECCLIATTGDPLPLGGETFSSKPRFRLRFEESTTASIARARKGTLEVPLPLAFGVAPVSLLPIKGVGIILMTLGYNAQILDTCEYDKPGKFTFVASFVLTTLVRSIFLTTEGCFISLTAVLVFSIVLAFVIGAGLA